MLIIMGLFLIWHGLIHLIYAGHTRRLFELRPGLIWPDGSWLFSKLLGDEITRATAIVLLVASALGFVAGGLGLFLGQDWWRLAVTGAAILSSVIYLVFWNGKFQVLDQQGALAILINLALVVSVWVLRWPF
jgi:hypothetical protein